MQAAIAELHSAAHDHGAGGTYNSTVTLEHMLEAGGDVSLLIGDYVYAGAGVSQHVHVHAPLPLLTHHLVNRFHRVSKMIA